jgi:hypothetical protein
MPRSKKKGEDDGTGSGGHDGEGTKEWEAVQGDIVEVLFGEEWRRAHLTMYDETAGKWRAAFEVPIEGLTETQIGIPDPSVRLVVGKQMEPPPPEPVAVVEAMAVPPVAPAAPPPAAPMVPMTVIAVPSESMEEDKPDGGIKTGTLQIGDHIEVKQEDGKFLKGEVKSKRKDGMWRVLYDSGDELHLKYPDDEREIRRLPRKTRPYECHACGKAFLRASHLSTHMRTHSGEKPHKCVHDGCGKAFAQSSNLRTHMRTHTGEKPYACVHVGCEKAFADPSALSAHKRIHTGERQHKCPECQKTFLRATHLTTHMRTHSGEKPHKCTVCPKAFAQSSNLSTHMRTHQPPGTDGKVGGLKRKRKVLTTRFQLPLAFLRPAGSSRP